MKLHKTKEKEVYYYFLKNGDKRFMYRHLYYDVTGVRREKSKRGFLSLRDATRSLIELKAYLLDGNHLYGNEDNLTVGQWFNIWYETYNESWAITTRKNREAFIKHHLQLIAHFKLKDLSRTQYINHFIKPLQDKGLNTRTIENYATMFRTGINAAIHEEIISKNRFNNIKIGDAKKLTNFLTPNELKIFLDYAKKEKIYNYTAIMTLAHTGMRKGELAALTWDDINFEDKTITINKTRDSYGVRKPKTLNSNRTILVDDHLMQQLKKYKTWCTEQLFYYGEQITGKKYVFINSSASPFFVKQCDLALKRIYDRMEKDEVKINEITVHGLRHTMATILIGNGIPVTTISKRLGNTPKIVMDTYSHSFSELEEKAVSSFSEALNL